MRSNAQNLVVLGKVDFLLIRDEMCIGSVSHTVCNGQLVDYPIWSVKDTSKNHGTVRRARSNGASSCSEGGSTVTKLNGFRNN